jgi:hypothetical protein
VRDEKEEKFEKSFAFGGLGCFTYIVVVFFVVFLITHWDQLQSKLASALGIG